MYKHFFKRFIDIVVSGIALIILAVPLLVVTVWLHFANKGAGAFFLQERPGKDAKIFRIVKFKTMTDERDADGNLLPDAQRLTKVGRLVRSTSIDELPQLWNVFRGDMSLIGPRPLLPQYLPYYTEREQTRHNVRPGITGLAQVNGRNHLEWDEKLELDAKYVENITFKGDFKIIIKTIQNVLKGSDVELLPESHDLDKVRNMNILFTCAGRRTYLLNYFRENLCCSDKIVATDMQLSAPALTAADIKEQVPSVYASDYIKKTIDICRKYNVKAIIPLNDLELPILSENADKFKEIGVFPIVSCPSIIDLSFDKLKTGEFIKRIGLKTPKTYTIIENAILDINKGLLSYPLVLKPRWGSGSIGIEIVNNEDELREYYDLLLKKVKKSILATASKDKEYILIQERIEGQEYGVDVMNDLKGNNRGISVKKKLAMRAGETDKAETVDEPNIRHIGEILAANLKHIGNLDVDIFEKDGDYYVLELNPRFGGGFPFSYEAGVNFPKALIEWLKGNEIDDEILVPRYGETYAKCDYLVKVSD